jgi:hypothetical protein
MENQYDAITETLKNDKNLYLQIHHYSMSAGLKDGRYVALFEPNPREGEATHTEGSIDQQGQEGPTREKRNFNFVAKDTLEGLALLEKACRGEKDLRNTVIPEYCRQQPVPGYATAKSGIDGWILEGYQFVIQNKPEGLKATMSSYFFETGTVVISSNIVNSVDEGIELYESFPQASSTLKNLRQGLLLDKTIRQFEGSSLPEYSFLAEKGYASLSPTFIRDYSQALIPLIPFELDDRAQIGLFVSMVLNSIYKDKPKSE